MGIKQLNKLISSVGENSTWESFRGGTIAIDASIYLYRFQGLKGLDKEKMKSQMLFGFFHQILMFKQYDIVPYYIFDGKPPDEKKCVLEERRERRKHAWEQIDEIQSALKSGREIMVNVDGDLRPASEKELKEKMDILLRATLKVKVDDITMVKEFLSAMGIPWFDATGEAEWFCAKLNQEGIVDACLSEDTDLLPNGAIVWIKDYKPYNKNIIVFHQNRVLEYLKMSFKEFVDLCIVMGCDNLPKLPEIGPAKALKFMSKHRTIEEFLKVIPSRNYPQSIRDEWRYDRARELFNENIDKETLERAEEKMAKQPPNKSLLLELFDAHCDEYKPSGAGRLRHKLIQYCDLML